MTSNGLVPLIRYRDVDAAIAWLGNAFGFEPRNVVRDPDGTVAYAELAFGRGVVMLGPVGHSVLDGLLKQPDELDGIGTQTVYVAVDDIEDHFKRARTAGAAIVLEFGSDEAGDRAYAARDLEGHVWNFGAYSPWPAVTAPSLSPAAEPGYRGRPSRAQAILGATVAVLAVASVAGLTMIDPPRPMPRFALRPAMPDFAPPRAAARASDDPAREAAALRDMLERESHARQEAARVAAAVREELAREKAARQSAEAARTALEKDLARVRETNAGSRKPIPTAAPAAAPAPAPAAAAAAGASATPDAARPTTTGSLGEQPRQAVNEPTAQQPAPSVTVQPLSASTPKAASDAAPSAAKKDKPKAAKQTRAPAAKRPQQRRNSGNDPFFMYD